MSENFLSKVEIDALLRKISSEDESISGAVGNGMDKHYESVSQIEEKSDKALSVNSEEESHEDKIDVKKPVFPSLSPTIQESKAPRNLDLIMDVPLEFSVVLGKSKKTIREVLSFGNGSVVELNKLAEEPLEVYVNGKLIALGEVVVINENFGIRITNILSKEQRVQNLK